MSEIRINNTSKICTVIYVCHGVIGALENKTRYGMRDLIRANRKNKMNMSSRSNKNVARLDGVTKNVRFSF